MKKRILATQRKSGWWFVVGSVLGLIFIGGLTETLGTTVTVNIAPGVYNDPYSVAGVGSFSGNTSFSATLGQTYTLSPWGGLASLGTFTVNDLGGGLAGITTSTPGLSGNSGVASPTLSFNNAPFTINRGANYGGQIGWDFKGLGFNSSLTDDTPLGTTSLRAWYGTPGSSGTFRLSTGANGNVSIVQQPTSGAILTTSGSTITLPTSLGIKVDVPTGITVWTLDWYQAGLSINDPTLGLLPGTWTFFGFTAGGQTTSGSFTIPTDYAYWHQSVTVTQGGNNYTFDFVTVPEPSTVCLLGLGSLTVWLARRRRG